MANNENRRMSRKTLENIHSIVYTDYYGWRDATKRIKFLAIAYYIISAFLTAGTIAVSLVWVSDFDGEPLAWYLAVFILHTIILCGDYILKWFTYPVHTNDDLRTGRIRFFFTWYNLYLLAGIILPIVGTILTVRVGRDASSDMAAGLVLFFIPRFTRAFSIINVIPGIVILKKAVLLNKSIFYTIITIFAIVAGIGAGSIFAAESGLENINGEVSIDAFWDALYFTMIAMTSVGLGDIVPLTVYGKIITVILGVVGVILFAIPAGIIAGSFSKAYKDFYDEPGNKHIRTISERVREKMVQTSSMVIKKSEKIKLPEKPIKPNEEEKKDE